MFSSPLPVPLPYIGLFNISKLTAKMVSDYVKVWYIMLKCQCCEYLSIILMILDTSACDEV